MRESHHRGGPRFMVETRQGSVWVALSPHLRRSRFGRGPSPEEAQGAPEEYQTLCGVTLDDPSTAPPEESLPPGWLAFTSAENGELYFYHADSGATTWQRPKAAAVTASGAGADVGGSSGARMWPTRGWFKYLDKSTERFYYHHIGSGTITWRAPRPSEGVDPTSAPSRSVAEDWLNAGSVSAGSSARAAEPACCPLRDVPPPRDDDNVCNGVYLGGIHDTYAS